jgi:1-deoxy-D-xylulose-5-phosphate synthase
MDADRDGVIPGLKAGALLPTIQTPQDLRRLAPESLPQIAQEIRDAICAQVAISGGHLAPNLGVVELTLAMHYVFDFGHDRLLFDVGHQCYPHKLLTGRLAKLKGLRTRDGIAGFPEPRESPYDLFSVGHAGTGISTAVGMARGDTLSKEAFDPKANPAGRRVVTLIGDASIVNGVAMEGLNNAGTLKRQFLVVLNDNGMSIGKPQGAVAHYFDKLRVSHLYSDFKKQARSVLSHVPGGDTLREAYHRLGEATKAMVNDGGWFEQFGLLTVGPIDGHDLPELVRFFREAREIDRPMVLHVKTIKGKGYPFAENDAVRFHSPGAFQAVHGDLENEGCRVELKSDGRSFTTAFADAMGEVMEKDTKVVACTAAMPDGTGLSKILTKHSDRAWDVGICESHALDMMAGLAKTGFKPFFAVYCTFLQRAFDQCFQEASLQGLPVRLCLDRAGLVGGDGAVHHGFCDIALLRVLPGAAITAAMDESSLKAALEFMRRYESGLSSVRYPRDNVSPRFAGTACPPFELGRARLLTPEHADLDDARPNVAVLAFGTCAIDAMAARDRILEGKVTGAKGAGPKGPKVAVWDARFAKPIDTELVRELLSRRVPIVTIEDHSVVAGFGAAVVEAASDMGLDASRVVRLGLPDSWVYQDSRAKQMAEVGLDADSLAKSFIAAAARAGDADGPVAIGTRGAKAASTRVTPTRASAATATTSGAHSRRAPARRSTKD